MSLAFLRQQYPTDPIHQEEWVKTVARLRRSQHPMMCTIAYVRSRIASYRHRQNVPDEIPNNPDTQT